MSKRINFFLKHLLISFIIAFIAVIVVFIFWYPSPLATAMGVTKIFLMLILIDVIVGPLLTLLVYKEGKKTLKLDISVIVILQLLALAFGLYNIEQGRPVWLAFQNNQFELVRHNDIIYSNNSSENEKYTHVNWLGPQFIGVNTGKTDKDKSKMLMREMSTGIMVAYRPELYMPIEESATQLLKEKRDLQVLKIFNEEDQVTAVVGRYPDAVGWLPLRVLTGIDMVVLIDKHGMVLGIADLRPWKLS